MSVEGESDLNKNGGRGGVREVELETKVGTSVWEETRGVR